MIPYLLNAYTAYRDLTGSFAPDRLLAAAVQPRATGGGATPKEQALSEVDAETVEEVRRLNLQTLAPGIFSIEMTRDQLLDIVEDHLRVVFSYEGGRESRFARSEAADAVLFLPARSVYVVLALDSKPLEETALRREAEERNPGETFVFALGTMEVNERLAPKFVSEERVLHGFFRVIPVANLLADAFGKHYHVLAVGRGRQGETVLATLQAK